MVAEGGEAVLDMKEGVVPALWEEVGKWRWIGWRKHYQKCMSNTSHRYHTSTLYSIPTPISTP